MTNYVKDELRPQQRNKKILMVKNKKNFFFF